jgi:phage shock protein A
MFKKELEQCSSLCDITIVNNVHITMYKTFITLLRGRAAEVHKEVADRNALALLDQQIRDATASLDRARKALAIAIGQDRQEAARLQATMGEIAQLETRVTAAIEAESDALAREGAEAIARLEADREASMSARHLFEREIVRLKAHVSQAEQRLTAVDRGRRIARASEAVRSLRGGRIETSSPYQATLSDAEATLTRLRERQADAASAEDVFDDLTSVKGPADISERLAAEGFGPRLRASADDVLERLKSRCAATVA